MLNNRLKDERNKSTAEKTDNSLLIKRIEDAYKTYKLSEVFLKDVSDDYGKQKIARLRYEFARHELLRLIDEARCKGMKWNENELSRRFFYPGT